MDQRDRVVGEQRVGAAGEREMVLHVALGFLRGQTADRVAHRNPLIQRGERAAPEPVTQGGLAEQQQAERRGLVHPHVRQAAHALQALGVQ